MKMYRNRLIIGAALVAVAGVAEAQVNVTENFAAGYNANNWLVKGVACLTAKPASSTTLPTGVTQIPTCSTSSQQGGYGDSTHTTGYMASGALDPAGQGALRLTSAAGSVAGAIIYTGSFPTTSGIAITFQAASYDGNSYSGSDGGTNGADGISFFLVDADKQAAAVAANSSANLIGQYGGSLGYSCAQGKGDGSIGGYIGLGLDEYGNFLNSGDNTATGVANTTNSGAGQFQGNRIGLRGAGNVSWYELNKNFPSYYPSSLSTSKQVTAVESTCQTGTLWNYSTSTATNTTLKAVVTWAQLNAALPAFYPSTMTSTAKTASVTNTETTATIWNYSVTTPVNTGTPLTSTNVTGALVLYDYAPITYTTTNATTGVTTTQIASLALSGSTLSTENANARNAVNSSTGTVLSRGTTLYTYSLKITSNGLLSLSYIPQTPSASSTSGIVGAPVTIATSWPIFGTNGVAPANLTFGFAASTGGGTNVHEITCFLASPAEDTDSSAAANALQAAQIQKYTAVYSAFYNTHDWWGQLISTGLNVSGSTVTINSTANWDASCVLTGDTTGTTLPGGNCAATGGTSDAATAPTSRVVYTWDGTNGKGIPFAWANLNSTQQGWLNAGDSLGTTRLNFLIGDRTQEVTSTNLNAPFRPRVSVLGDIINSSPVWVGSPAEPFPTGANWADNLNASATMPENSAAVPYGLFATAQQATRRNIVYVGSNDGFVHGFEAGNYDPVNGTTTTFNDGKEVLAYMPNAVMQNIHDNLDSQGNINVVLDYTSPSYGHNYYVDSTPNSGDLYYNGAWHTWLMGGLGAGGAAIYALDVTNPQNFASTSTAANSVVMGEWTSATAGLGDLGYTYGTPQLGRFHNGQWAIVFGNGYQNTGSSHNGAVFLGLVSPSTGAVSFTELKLPSTAAGTSANPNGIISVFIADFDNDHIVDYIYAGDMLGNVWRFDVTGSTTSAWTNATPLLLFSAPSNQSIFSQVQVSPIFTKGGFPRVMIDFGTGLQVETPLQTSLATGQQAAYGIWDGNFTTWNNEVSSLYQMRAYPSSVTQPHTVTLGTLELQTTTASGTTTNTTTGAAENYRVISANAVCWAEQSGCSSSQQFGWYYDFPLPAGVTSATGLTLEQVVANPSLALGAFNVVTYVPAGAPSCSQPQGPTGWSFAIDPLTGGALQTSFFTDVIGSLGIASGIQSSSTGGSSILSLNGSLYQVSTLLQAPAGGKSVTGQTQIEKIQVPAGLGLRLNWSELR